jgi:beta-RFAP synthase
MQTAEALARAVGRGRRSAVGIHGACLGGLIIEGGKLANDEISPLLSRIALPDSWRFLLLLPDEGTGLSGEVEQQAFAQLPPVPAEVTAALCRELVCDLAPAAVRGDFERFSDALYRYGRLAGECFAARQGGAYASRETERLVMRCRELGVRGVGQSSWGPTLFALCRDARQAESLAADLTLSGELSHRKTLIAAPDNRGIQVEEIEGDTY